jgi:hypothetical protein
VRPLYRARDGQHGERRRGEPDPRQDDRERAHLDERELGGTERTAPEHGERDKPRSLAAGHSQANDECPHEARTTGRSRRSIRLRKHLLFVANALKQHPVGLEEIEDDVWPIYFCHVLLGRVDERDHIIRT